MNKLFKQLLIKIARLTKRDQAWILNQLNTTQKNQFSQWNGNNLLQKAQRFRSFSYSKKPYTPQTTSLPIIGQKLQGQDPLLIAIILKEGQFTWEKHFLERETKKDEIMAIRHQYLPMLKPETTACLFKHWQKQFHFHDFLEHPHDPNT